MNHSQDRQSDQVYKDRASGHLLFCTFTAYNFQAIPYYGLKIFSSYSNGIAIQIAECNYCIHILRCVLLGEEL